MKVDFLEFSVLNLWINLSFNSGWVVKKFSVLTQKCSMSSIFQILHVIWNMITFRCLCFRFLNSSLVHFFPRI
jgi:hypothetical protein